jgi:DNA-binding response OmpR family regulator
VQDKPLVLVVEDDEGSFDAIGTLLRHIGYAVVGAATVRDALAELEVRRPACVVLDLTLADGSGLDLLRHVRHRRLPVQVVVTTGATDPDLLERVRGLSPQGLFHKPTEIPGLFAWLRQHRGELGAVA